MNILPLLLLLLVLAAWLALTVGVGVYVYRDAGRRGMNAALWALVALLAPSLIGFAVYLVVRGGYADLECPACGAAVEESYAVCPQPLRLRLPKRFLCLSQITQAGQRYAVIPVILRPLVIQEDGAAKSARRLLILLQIQIAAALQIPCLAKIRLTAVPASPCHLLT